MNSDNDRSSGDGVNPYVKRTISDAVKESWNYRDRVSSDETKRKISDGLKRAYELGVREPTHAGGRKPKGFCDPSKPHPTKGKLFTPHGHKVESKLRAYKKRAHDGDINWALTDGRARELFVSDCFYCGKSPEMPKQPNGIDRMDCDKGYEEGNVVPCCYRCNVGKHTMSFQEFVEWIERVQVTLQQKQVTRNNV